MSLQAFEGDVLLGVHFLLVVWFGSFEVPFNSFNSYNLEETSSGCSYCVIPSSVPEAYFVFYSGDHTFTTQARVSENLQSLSFVKVLFTASAFK